MPGISQILSLILEQSHKSETIFILYPTMTWGSWCANQSIQSDFQATLPPPTACCHLEQITHSQSPMPPLTDHTIQKDIKEQFHSEKKK